MNLNTINALMNPCSTRIGGRENIVAKAKAEKLLTLDTENLSATVDAMKAEHMQVIASRKHEDRPELMPMKLLLLAIVSP